jgi:hypothetical protein
MPMLNATPAPHNQQHTTTCHTVGDQTQTAPPCTANRHPQKRTVHGHPHQLLMSKHQVSRGPDSNCDHKPAPQTRTDQLAAACWLTMRAQQEANCCCAEFMLYVYLVPTTALHSCSTARRQASRGGKETGPKRRHTSAGDNSVSTTPGTIRSPDGEHSNTSQKRCTLLPSSVAAAAIWHHTHFRGCCTASEPGTLRLPFVTAP